MDHRVLSSPSPEDAYFSSPEYDEVWIEAEQQTAILLGQIQPSKQSEESRRAVIDYVQQLIERELNCKVFSFGSVPLKTYLPDGDIDLTAISQHHDINEAWARDVCTVLEREERIHNPEFHVKEVKCISAEVSVVKCLVENIIIDITFNQLGGLSTLCFLEEVDTLIGRDHLFKRSIILVKAWCFYESRILGAHHGLLSTYALEVLVLYIFHVFHRSLRGPLEVLFRFLQFFSKFDWEQHCLSLWGPVPLGSLNSMTGKNETEKPSQNSDGNFLLSEAFLKRCRETYSTLLETNQSKTFSRKFMNLVDPLRPFNNLGRSVNSGNLVRIYRAFAYGAAELEQLLQSPKEHAVEKLASFFRNTQKHCQGHRPDAGVLSFKGNTPLCNGNSRSEEAVSRVIGISSDLKDVINLEHRNTNGTYAEKPACVNVDYASLQVDDVRQCIADAKLDETSVTLHDKDNRPCGCAGDLRTWSSDEIECACKRVTNDIFSMEKAVERPSGANACSETHVIDSLPAIKRFSVDVVVCKSFENSIHNHHVSDESMVFTKSEEDVSTSPSASTLASVHSSEAGADGPGEDILSKEQAVFCEGDFRRQMQASNFRDTDAAILDGDFESYFKNLQDGWVYRNSHPGGNFYAFHSFHSRGSAWEGPGRPLPFDRFSLNGRYNVPILGGASGPNSTVLEGFPKHQRGTGTFFPNLKSTFERDKRIYSNGVRSPRRTSGNTDSFSSVNNASSGFRSKSHVPRKHDGSNKARPRKITDLKTGEQQQDLFTEDAALGNELQSLPMNTADNFAHSPQRHVDSRLSGDQRLTTMDWSPRSPDAAIVPTSGNNKDLPLEKLEIGSFGPGFLAKGLQKISECKDRGECASQSGCPSPRDDCSEPPEAASKADHADQQESAYYLKEEDFPPLSSVSPREVPNTAVAERTASNSQGSYHKACVSPREVPNTAVAERTASGSQGSYHKACVSPREVPNTVVAASGSQGSYYKACVLSHSTYATKIAQNG
eukprot:c17993_g1_i1 orf=290-3292(-)